MNLHRKVIGRCKARVTVTCPISIDSVADDGDSLLFISPEEFHLDIDTNEIKETLDTHIPGAMRADYNKILSKTPIPKKRRDAVLNEVKRIIRTHLPSYLEEDDG